MKPRPNWPPPYPNDDDAHTAAALMYCSRLVEDFIEIDMRDGTRLWITPGMGVMFPDAGASDDLIAARKRVRELERELLEHRRNLNTDRLLDDVIDAYRNDTGGDALTRTPPG